MKPFSILLFSVILFMSLNVTGALVAYFFYMPSMEKWTPFQLLLIHHGPVCFVSIAVFYFLAKQQLPRPYVHAFLVLFIVEMLDILVMAFIAKEFYISPSWVFDFPVSILTLLIGTILGIMRIKESMNQA
jgi:hypothetical protein